MYKSTLILATAALASAQDSICDRYTTALFMDNTAANQYTLLKSIVNTAVIGNGPMAMNASNQSLAIVQGILNADGVYYGPNGNVSVNLLPYFDGGLMSTNRNGMPATVNFLDDGGAAPLINNEPANGTDSNQYMLLTHLYQFFGALLGCSEMGSDDFSAYMGVASQYTVHQYMDLNQDQMNYFIQEVAMSATAFGVTSDDIMAVGTSLNKYFNVRCYPATDLGVLGDAVLPSICIDPSCPIVDDDDVDADCGSYGAVLAPIVANESLADGQGVSSTVTLLPSGATSADDSTSTGSNTMSTGSNTMTGTTSTGTGMSSASAGQATTGTGSSFARATAAPVVGAVLAAGAFVLAL